MLSSSTSTILPLMLSWFMESAENAHLSETLAHCLLCWFSWVLPIQSLTSYWHLIGWDWSQRLQNNRMSLSCNLCLLIKNICKNFKVIWILAKQFLEDAFQFHKLLHVFTLQKHEIDARKTKTKTFRLNRYQWILQDSSILHFLSC